MSVKGCPFLSLENIEPGCWSFCDVTDGQRELPRRVGPLYPTKEAALADFRRYAYESWGWGEKPQAMPRFATITAADVDAHNGLWMVLWRTGRLWRVGPLRRGEWTAERLEMLTECGMPLNDEGQPTVVEVSDG